MRGTNNIFLAGDDALAYIAEPMHKEYSITFACGHPFSSHVSYDWFFKPLPLYAPVHILDGPLHSPSVAHT